MAIEEAGSSSEESDLDDGEWLDIEPDEELMTVISFFDDRTFPTVHEMLAHCKEKHDFDFLEVVRRLKLDFLGAAKLVNFIRSSAKTGKPVPLVISSDMYDDETNLRPTLPNDAVLFSLDEILQLSADENGDGHHDAAALLARNRDLEDELETLRHRFANYRLTVEDTLDKRWGGDVGPGPELAPRDSSEYYWESYAAHEIHETMLKDTVRTDAYRDFIYNNKQLFMDKIVLDIGCGTGILSMFCAKAGAKQVIAVDKSDIIIKARENIFNNGLANNITCLHGTIEDLILPVDKVDVIVSEWMGYFLLYEAMLPSVLYARDKYLKADGILAPSSCSMWIAPVADPDYTSDRITFWRDVYGFDMGAMQEGIYEEARVDVISQAAVCGTPYPFKVLDLHTATRKDLNFTANWESQLMWNIDELDGFAIWFDSFFATSRSEPVPERETSCKTWMMRKLGNIAFSTGPFDISTHWKQGLLLTTPENSDRSLSSSQKLAGDVTFAALEENARALRLTTSWSAQGGEERSQTWKMI